MLPSFPRRLVIGAALSSALLVAFSNIAAFAQQPPQTQPARLVQPIDEHLLLPLRGHVRQDVAHAPDLGAVEDAQPLHLFLLLQRTAAQQADLDNLIARQQQPGAPEYHKWLTPAEFGARFGASPDDIATISAWLGSHGFEVRHVLNNAGMIDVAGTAGQVREAFHTQLHYFKLRGGKYPAVIQDPQIPAALAPVVVGIQGLNKIPALMNHTAPRQASRDQDTHRWQIVHPTAADLASPAYTAGGGNYFVSPQDLYTIYKVNPVFAGGNLAATATVAVIEESDIEYGTVNSTTGAATGGDVVTFRNLFGVPGTLNMHVYHGYGSVTCNDPGIDPDYGGEDIEASLDAEWINATAPSANLIFMSCDQSPNLGILTSMAALIDNNLADVMSMSYSEGEQFYTASDFSFQDNLYAQAAAQGQSIVISAGDSGSAVADQGQGLATSGISVSAFGAPTVTVAGGTDFQDVYDAAEGGPPQSTYWGSTNSAHYGDALGYVPETAWNNSCAGSLRAIYAGNYTGVEYCITNDASNNNYVDIAAGSGGTSTHYAAPSWQSSISGYSSWRSQPDISGFASSSSVFRPSWGHALLYCDSNYGQYDCASSSSFGSSGGTSFVAPYMAGVFGLLRTATGSRQGVLNPTLYALALAQYLSPSTTAACYANGQTSNTGVTTGLPAAACIFNDVTTGNNNVPCQIGSPNCYVEGAGNPQVGVLSWAGASSLQVAYDSTIGLDRATGLGSVNVANLIADWNTAFTSSTTLQATSTSLIPGDTTRLTATVSGGTPAGYVGTPPPITGTATFKAGNHVIGTCTVSGGTCSSFVQASSLQSGPNSVTATFTGGTYPSSTSAAVNIDAEVVTVWIADGAGGSSALGDDGTALTSGADPGQGTALAVDHEGNIWTVGNGPPVLEQMSADGTVLFSIGSAASIFLPSAIAVDGKDRVWVASRINTVAALSTSAAPLSPPSGFTDSSLSDPAGIAIDLGGSVWITNKGNGSITRILGGAAPVAPLATAVANNTTGAEP